MKLRVLALDYDGTIATAGMLHAEVRAAIEAARARGLVVVLVTGRVLAGLRPLVGDLGLFDAVVAENGAMLTFPKSGRSAVLARPIDEPLLAALRRRGLQVHAGNCVVELDATDAQVALDVVHRLQLPLALHFNRGRLMLLPLAVSKGTGLREALRTMRLSPHNAIAVGDAENDHELLAACEIGYAVAWGSKALQAYADALVVGDGPAAIAGWIHRITASGFIHPPIAGRRQLVVGRQDDGAIANLPMRSRNVLIAGGAGSGKSWLAGLVCEQLLAQQYSICLIDPEGDYGELEAMPGMLRLGGDDPPPSLPELARVLRHADISVLVDLARLPLEDKRTWVAGALQMLAGMRQRTGLPHRIVLDEAHYFLARAEDAALLDLELGGHVLVTWRVTDLHPDVTAGADCVMVTRETDAAAAQLLHRRFCGREDLARWQQVLAGLPIDEAVLLPSCTAPEGPLRRFRVAPRQTLHVRHRHKYLDVPVRAPHEFRFTGAGGGPVPVARSLQEMVDVLATTPTGRLAGHIRRSDFSRWLRDVVKDETLATAVALLEQRHRDGGLADFNGAVISAVHGRYHVADDLA
jgi:hydroxymethylpyrimidine pyrophosphatase-like HAD family hydrolase